MVVRLWQGQLLSVMVSSSPGTTGTGGLRVRMIIKTWLKLFGMKK